jgi:hypothetical protein
LDGVDVLEDLTTVEMVGQAARRASRRGNRCPPAGS